MIIEQTFEVVVVVTPKGQPPQLNYQSGRSNPSSVRGGATTIFRKDMLAVATETRMYHIKARDHDQAFERGKKYGRPISARKFQRERVAGNIEHLKLNQGTQPIFENALAMDDFIWLKKAKRSARIETNKKDRAGA